MNRLKVLIVVVVSLLCHQTAFATITNGIIDFDYTEAGLPGSTLSPGLSNFRLPSGGTDQMFQNWWWFRVSTDTQERVFLGASTEFEAGAVNTLTFASLGGLAASVSGTLVHTLSGDTMTQVMTLTNGGASPLTIDVFHYLDLDLAATGGSDSATGGLGGITVTEGATSLTFVGVGASAFQVTTFPTLRDALNNASITNLNNTGLPFGPADFTGAFQWSSVILAASGGTADFTSTIGPSAAVPEPVTTALMAAGLAGLLLWRRRGTSSFR